MSTSIYHFTDRNENYFSFIHAASKGPGNEKSRERMKVILSRAIETELTDMQRLCLTDYYFRSKKQKEIAQEHGLNSSTVCRHIKAAKKKLKNIADYYIS